MTRQEAIKKLREISDEYLLEIENSFDIAIECIQECIDKEESPCFNCVRDDCKGCLHSNRLE